MDWLIENVLLEIKLDVSFHLWFTVCIILILFFKIGYAVFYNVPYFNMAVKTKLECLF